MANVGAWQSPFPLRLGGGSHARCQRIYDEIRANVPGLLANESGKVNVADDLAAARLIAAADRFIDRRLNQIDPMKLSTEMVVRWETILAITPPYQATWYDRRRAIASRQLRNTLIQRGDIDRLVEDAFAPWDTALHFIDKADAVVYWPAGTWTADLFWYSTVATVVVEYVVSATTTQDEIDQRVSACTEALDELLPAWTRFSFSQTQDYGVNAGLFGFYLDQPNLDVSVFSI